MGGLAQASRLGSRVVRLRADELPDLVVAHVHVRMNVVDVLTGLLLQPSRGDGSWCQTPQRASSAAAVGAGSPVSDTVAEACRGRDESWAISGRWRRADSTSAFRVTTALFGHYEAAVAAGACMLIDA